ncbi:unnamed protein product [Paramecium sonneborni]|uniref:Uncharacterized protein n=1 Tax=Paramecium sonneborni TaxID=65129 RepID=A0A8S1RDW6_9CILI|nr:unnamed protein product [Paramecium sonneborni]
MTRLNYNNQIQRNNIQINEEDYSISNFFTYGIWSKYNPLSIIKQNGLYGLFDSNCYQLHNAIDFEQQSLNLIYYDFLDYEQQSITKIIQFIGNDNRQHIFEINIGEYEYENIWYCLQIYAWPQLNTFDLIIAKNQDIILRKQLQIKYPFMDNNLILTFGGSFKVVNSKITEIYQGTVFSSFPGQIILQEFSIEQKQPNFDPGLFIDEAFQNINVCICEIGEDDIKIQDQNINYLDQYVYVSEQINCDSFILIGWFKVIEIVSMDQEYKFQIIKLGPNLDSEVYQNNNLAAFQLYYLISETTFKIFITTYSYLFPGININFENNPFLIQKEYLIPQNFIKNWHYLFVKLKSTQLYISIIFYQNDNNFEINDEIEVIQFTNVQFKLQYGNIQQQDWNYLIFKVNNLILYNCETNINKQGCHFSCKECDGPLNSNCLSCHEDSQRIYLSEYKVCICPSNSIDKDEKCLTDKNQKFSIIEQNNDDINKNCKQGFFELDGECYKCPSIISENSISCYECYKNPQGWSSNPNCDTDLYLKASGTVEDTMIRTYSFFYQFDGLDLNFCYYCWQIKEIQNEEGNYNLYQYLSFGFINFCQIEEIRINSNQCYVCTIDFCQDCYITLLGMRCLRCLDSYEFFNGKCIPNIFINPYPKEDNLDNCLPPFYITSKQQCILCPIINCVYCFEYVDNFLEANSLKSNNLFIYQEDLKIACALCKQNYLYDFTLKICIMQETQLPNCLRSFIDLNNQELCTLSSIDFSNSPEMNDCFIHISNCQQCLQYHSNIICVVCQQGYVVEYEQCIQNEELIQPSYQLQSWRMQVESFRLQFAPLLQDFDYQIMDIQNKCDPNCLHCQIQSIYYCELCSLNYFKQRMRVERGQKCSDCPQLCQLCIQRSQEDIQLISPQFEINDENFIYTKSCLKPYNHPLINFNPYYQISKYCINQICNYYVQIDRVLNLCDPIRFFNFGYQDYFDIDYFNQLGINSILLNSTFQIRDQLCFSPFSILAQNNLKKKIFSLQEIKLILNSKNTLFFQLFGLIQIFLYDSIFIENIGFIFDTYSVGQFKFINNNQKVDITLKDFIIQDSYLQNADSILNTLIFGNIKFINVTIQNTSILNSSFLNLDFWNFVGQIIIETMTISNSIIVNSQLFKFSKSQFTILIKDVKIDQCELFNSSLFHFNTNSYNYTNLIFQNLKIKDSKFINSSFLDCSSQMALKINNFSFINNFLSNSIIIGFSYNLSLFQIEVIDNVFVDSQFLSTIQMLYDLDMPCKIQYFKAISNKFQNSNLFLIFSTYQLSSLIIEISDLILEYNSKSNNSNQSIYLFNINCYSILIQDVKIINSNDIHIFYLFENQKIIIENVLYEQQEIKKKVQLSQNCIEQVPTNQLLQILGFINIVLQNLKVLKQISIDETIIQITQSKQQLSEINRQIKISNLIFYGNLLLQSFQIIPLSLITINSDQNVNIQLENIEFQKNFIHVYQEGSLLYSAGLIYITSTQSQVIIKDLLCLKNAFTNSSNSFIIVTADSVKLYNIEVNYHNVLSLNLWQEYYNISIEIDNSQEKVNQFISQVFQIKTIGGVFQISASNIFCINSRFTSIYASKSQVFDIITFGSGNIYLENIFINSTLSDLISKSKSSGCININSQTSLLNLSLINIVFFQVQNRITSSILSISPSSFSNQLLFKNIIIENCISLLNQIINIPFYQSIAELNQLTFQNIKITQNLDAMIKFFQSVKSLSSNEVLEITGINNAALVLENCITQINGLIFEGIFIGRLLKFINNPRLIIRNCKIENIQALYSLDLIYISQNIQQKSIIYFNQLSISKVSLLEIKLNQIFQEKNYIYSIFGCILDKQIEIIEEQHDYLKENIIALQQSQQNQINSLLYIQCTSNLNELYFNFIKIQSNNCTTCSKGIVQIEIENFKKFVLLQVNCNFNSIKNFGCLNFQSQLQIQSKIIIHNSNFIHNIGGDGVAIRVLKVPLIIKQCKILYNMANEKGGGFYIELNSNIFLIKDTIIINNRARIGGGIYLVGDANLNKANLINSTLIYNTAKVYGNNIVEQPTHLALQINNNEQPSSIFMENNTKLYVLHLQAYKTIEQSIQKISNNLMIPSNQEIQNYALFYIKEKQYITYIKEICLYFKNSYNEVVLELKDSSCIVYEYILSNSQSKGLISSKNQTLQFNQQKNCFDIGPLSFSLDPYNQSENYLQIFLSCNSGLSNKNLKYIINANSFKCQLGEFYIDNGCQICNSNQGFYSVTYDAVKCSIFDKTKFQNITSNMIQLQKGNWRPNYYSDYCQSCFKNLDFCIGGWDVGNQLCKVGHIGGLCEECDVNNIMGDGYYFKNQWDLSCFRCFGIDNGVLPFLLALIQALVSITLTLRSIQKSNRLFASLKIGQKFSNIIFRLNQDHESILLKMWLNYLWIFSVIFTFNINFKFQFTLIDSTSNSFYFMAYNLDCYLSNSGIHLIYIRIFLIIFLMLIQFLIILIASFIYQKVKKQQIDYSILSTTLLYLFVFNYGGLIKMLCSIVSIRKISTIDYIQGDVSLKYGTDDHLLWITYLIIPGLLLFGCLIPFGLFLLMYAKRHQFDLIRIRKHICYLMNEYAHPSYFWEFIKISNKAIIILITTYYETNVLLKASLLGLCLLFYQILADKNKPYYLSKFNTLDLRTGQLCSISIFLAAIKYFSEEISHEILSVILSIIIILLCFKLCFPFIMDILKVYYKKFKSPIISCLISLINKVFKNSMISRYLVSVLQQWKLSDERLKLNYTKLRQNLFTKSKIMTRSKKLSLSFFNSTYNKIFQQNSFGCFMGLDQD